MSETEPIPPTSSVTALRIPIIKKGKYDLWSMKMRQYIAITDHILWVSQISSSTNSCFLSTEVQGQYFEQSTAEQQISNKDIHSCLKQDNYEDIDLDHGNFDADSEIAMIGTCDWSIEQDDWSMEYDARTYAL
ncbi:hypothetical protein Tco_1509947 [Tanacetum coccineum]